MNQFVTVSKKDANFWPLLTGEFSRDQFARPISNLHVNSLDETVTFKIIDKESQSLVSALAHWYSFARNIYLIFPALGGLSFLLAFYGTPDPYLVLSSLLSLQFFLLALTLYNDYTDYLNGVDRINEYSSQKPLVQGWVRPYQARQLAQFFLLMATLFGFYCFLTKPLTLLLAFGALIVGGSLASTSLNRRFKGVSLVATFLLGGPFLILGFEFLLFDQFSWPAALLGAVFGYHALKYDFTKQVRDIYYSSKAKLVTLSTLFGFERSKFIYILMSVCHLTVLSLFAYLVGDLALGLVVVVALCFEAYINHMMFVAPSFLSSNISQCLSLQKLHYTIESLLFVFYFLSPLWLSL